MIALGDIFDISYGNQLDLNKLQQVPLEQGGVSFVGRSSENHGISATVALLANCEPYEAGLITVALGGTKLLSAFVQERPFYTAQNVAILRPKVELAFAEKLYTCLAIRRNRFRYSAFGREANRTLKQIMVPYPTEVANWGDLKQVSMEDLARSASGSRPRTLNTDGWREFELQELFEIGRGTGPRKKDIDGSGATPFVTSIASNNGWAGFVAAPACHPGNTIGVNRNGSVGNAFYQPRSFCSTEDVHVFLPKFQLNAAIGLFLTTILRREQYRFGYGRKWGIKRMKGTRIRLPVTAEGKPDWNYMEQYIKALPFSSQIGSSVAVGA